MPATPTRELEAHGPIVETARLQLRKVALSDGPFFLRLLNEPSWLENIGDRHVRSIAQAEDHIKSSIWTQYRASGYGMYAISLKATLSPIGICGLVERSFLPAPDLGFALLPAYVGQGFAFEAAHALLEHASSSFGIGQLYAIVKRDNGRSIKLLGRLGFHRERPYSMPQGEEVELYAVSIP